MPSRAAATDFAFPCRLPWFGGFPERKISRAVFFVLVQINSGTVFHAGKIFLRKLAVAGKLRDSEVVRTIVRAIRETLLYKPGNKIRHFINVFSSAHQFGLLDIQGVGVLKKGLLEFCRELLQRNSSLDRIADDLVIHICDIHYVPDFVSTLPQETPQDVNSDKCPEVANVPIVVDGGTASVHADFVVA